MFLWVYLYKQCNNLFVFLEGPQHNCLSSFVIKLPLQSKSTETTNTLYVIRFGACLTHSHLNLEIKPIENSKHSNFKGFNDSCPILIFTSRLPFSEIQSLCCLSLQLSFIYIDYVLNSCRNTGSALSWDLRSSVQQSSALQNRPPKQCWGSSPMPAWGPRHGLLGAESLDHNCLRHQSAQVSHLQRAANVCNH